LNQNQQKIHSSNELAKATEITPFLGVIDSGFVQRIAHNYIKPPRAFLFSHYILSKIQRRLTAGTSAVRFRDFAPYTLETLAVGRQASSENTLAPEKASEISLSTSPLQPLLLRTPVKNALGQFGLQTVREGGSLAEERAQISNFKLLFSEEPSHILSVKPVVHEVTSGPEKLGLLSQRRTEPGEVSTEGSEQEGIISQSFLQKKQKKSESSQIEESVIPTSPFEGPGILGKPVSSVRVSINNASFADKVAEKSKSETSIVGSDTHSRIGLLNLATLREVASSASELTHIQRKKGHESLMEQTDVIIDRKTGTYVQPGTRDTLRAPTPQSSLTGPAPLQRGTGGARSILAGATPILASGKMEPVVQSLSGLKPTIGIWNSDFPISFRIPHSEFRIPVSRRDKILTTQDKSAEGVNRQTAEQQRESTNNVIARAARPLESPTLTIDNLNILRRFVPLSPAAISEAPARPVGMLKRGITEEISGGMQPTHVGNAKRIFSQYLDMPHVRLHNDAEANFMAAKLNAEAFTIERDVFLASGKLNLSTQKGIALLGHELTHVKQQEQQSAISNGKVGVLQREALENEALANEQRILSFLSTQPQTFTPSQRDIPIITRKMEYTGDEPVELTHIQGPAEIQYAMPQRVSTPLMAEEGRGMETVAPAETPAPSPPEPTTPSMDINRIAEEVYEIIERRLRSEKERRGYF